MGNQVSTSVHGPGERREAGGVVKCSNGLPQKSQPRLKGGVGCTSSSASSTNPAHTSTGIRRMRPVTYKVPPLHCRHVRTRSYGAHLCKTLSYKKLERERAAQSTQSLTQELIPLNLQTRSTQCSIPTLSHFFSTQNPTLWASKMAQWEKALAAVRTAFNSWDSYDERREFFLQVGLHMSAMSHTPHPQNT